MVLMNSLLKLILTLGISFSLVTSVLAEDQLIGTSSIDTSEKDSQKTPDNLGTTSESNKKGETEDTGNSTKNPQQEDSANNNNSTNSPATQRQIPQDKTETKKSLGLTDILLLLNLLISSTFFSLWFFNQKKLQDKINKLLKNSDQILNQSKQLNNINSHLNKLETSNGKIVKKIEEVEENNLKSQHKIDELISKQQSSVAQNNYNNLTPPISQFQVQYQSQPHFTSVAVVDELTQLIDKYNRDKNSFSSLAIDTVAEPKESLEQRRYGSSETVILEHTNKKKYWIIEKDNQYYLIPHANISIDEYNIKTLENLFDCTNFTAEHSNFELIKPAKVSKQPSETWQIEEKGKLNFN